MSMSRALPQRLTQREERELVAKQARVAKATEELNRRQCELDQLVLELTEANYRAADIADVLGVKRSSVYFMANRAKQR